MHSGIDRGRLHRNHVDEPVMSSYALRKTRPVGGLLTAPSALSQVPAFIHLCFGNYKGAPFGPRSYRPEFPSSWIHRGRNDVENGEPRGCELELSSKKSARV